MIFRFVAKDFKGKEMRRSRNIRKLSGEQSVEANSGSLSGGPLRTTRGLSYMVIQRNAGVDLKTAHSALFTNALLRSLGKHDELHRILPPAPQP